jgi:hypothetical protein
LRLNFHAIQGFSLGQHLGGLAADSIETVLHHWFPLLT